MKGAFMKKIIFLLLIISITAYSQGGRLIPDPIRNIPKWVRTQFSAQHLDQHYTIVYQLYPYHLHADFNGDGLRDIAIQVIEKSSNKMGVAIFHAKKKQKLTTYFAIISAGKTAGEVGDDLSWVDVWNVQRKSTAIESGLKKPPLLFGDAISLEKRDSTSGLIYWNGEKYLWFKIK
jgi:hypothetical protein